VIPLSWNLDHVSPITRTVEDAAILLEAIAGKDQKDTTSSENLVPHYRDAVSKDFRQIKAGILTKYFEECIDQEVRKRVEAAVEAIKGLGVKVSEISIPNLERSAPVANMLIACEATSNHEKWLKERREDYQPSVRTRLEVGYFYSANHYIKALRLREWFRREFDRVFRNVDVLLSPTCPILPFRIGQETMDLGGLKTDPRPFIANFVRIYNLLGLPAISIPCGFSSTGLPIGLQIAGRPFDEEMVLNLAYAYEQSQAWKDRLPKI
jgi:aspartyl-tRNA(Asn)/glutamyl-tRNA(Gln) amidotransferase subunit A